MAAAKVGNLTKRGHGFPHSWQERVFSLYPDKLDYGTLAGVAKGSFPVCSSSTVESFSIAESPEKKDNCFKLSSGEKYIFMHAVNAAERSSWIEAIKIIISAATAVSEAEVHALVEEADRLAREQEDADRLEAEEKERRRIAEEQERLALILAAKEMDQLLYAQAEEERQKDKSLAALKLADEKKKMREAPVLRVHTPVFALKKIDSEARFGDRYVWIEHDTNCFHWARTVAEGPSSKNINIKAHISHCEVGKLSDTDPSFSLVLKEGTDAPGFSKGFMGSTKAGRVDVVIPGSENQTLVAEFVSAINGIVTNTVEKTETETAPIAPK